MENTAFEILVSGLFNDEEFYLLAYNTVQCLHNDKKPNICKTIFIFFTPILTVLISIINYVTNFQPAPNGLKTLKLCQTISFSFTVKMIIFFKRLRNVLFYSFIAFSFHTVNYLTVMHIFLVLALLSPVSPSHRLICLRLIK